MSLKARIRSIDHPGADAGGSSDAERGKYSRDLAIDRSAKMTFGRSLPFTAAGADWP